MSNKMLFLTLRVFSATGGIEKVCRILSKAFYEMSFSGTTSFEVISSHDKTKDGFNNKYIPIERFTGHGNRRFGFVKHAFKKGIHSDTVILSHINLLPVGWLIKKVSPKTRLILMAHGIEIWSMPLGIKKKLLNACDEILCVSQYTKDQIASFPELKKVKLTVLNNCLDPYLSIHSKQKNENSIRAKYGILSTDKVAFTLTRMDASERYKGYDRVIEAIAAIREEVPELKYVIGGSYDSIEKEYILTLADKLKVSGNVILTGYIPDEALEDYFQMSDLYVMPSYNEGFGIVFIEAMYYGLPVIAGNKDGSVDAILNGKLGTLIDPMNINELMHAILAIAKNKENYKPDKKILIDNFGYENYTHNLKSIFLN